ncbi:MAG: aminotransferase class I/II-fold pyridoxal phosphate-dependent enzyme [Deltaproteobacteria bacterium]|nr:aminotransferase class I/II-fold pyridoxal phosphate-dependent enzyme [Deltaproteobacteria bacterium]
MGTKSKPGFATACVHGRKHLGKHDEDFPIRSVSTPIYMSSTFAFASAEEGAAIFDGSQQGYVYTRIGNPTVMALEKELAYLEGTDQAIAFASGMAAISSVILALCRPGDNLVATHCLYGGTHKLLDEMVPRLGLETRFVSGTNLDAIAAACDGRTRLIFTESPANPTMEIVDLEALAGLAKTNGVPLVVDNTFATPYLQNPVDMGAEIIVHSATKYIGGHGDTVAGLVCGSGEFIDRLRGEYLRDLGAAISPFNAWLLLRGLKTLPVRIDRHCENATAVAQYLNYHPRVERVAYPGLKNHPQHDLAKRQMRDFGGMLAFDVEGGRDAGRVLCNNVRLCTLAVSLGDVDTLIEHPASMTHSTYSEEQLAAAHIGPGMIRLSVGLEDADDLIEDLRQALARL